MAAAALLGIGSSLSGEVGVRLLLSPLGSLSPLNSNIVIHTRCCSVGIALPVYSTYKAIKSKIRMSNIGCSYIGQVPDVRPH